MARNPKNGKGGETEVVATTLLMPDPKKIVALAKARRGAKKRTAEIAGELGNDVGKAVEKDHLDRKAFSIACQLDALSDEKFGVTYFHLLRYLDDLGVPARAKAQTEMFDGDAEDDKPDKGNVTSIGAAARKVAETAGEKLPA